MLLLLFPNAPSTLFDETILVLYDFTKVLEQTESFNKNDRGTRTFQSSHGQSLKWREFGGESVRGLGLVCLGGSDESPH
jgi:hypothetical protein